MNKIEKLKIASEFNDRALPFQAKMFKALFTFYNEQTAKKLYSQIVRDIFTDGIDETEKRWENFINFYYKGGN